MKELFEKIGLTHNESTLYLLLLDLGQSSAGDIIKKSGFQSSVVYHLLNSLMEKGIVGSVRSSSKKFYSATSPGNIKSLFEEKQFELQKSQKEFEKILPTLMKKKAFSSKNNVVQIYQGSKGLKTAFNEILQNAKSYLVYGGTGNFTQTVKSYKTFFRREKKERKITQKNLFFGKLQDRDRVGITKHLIQRKNHKVSFIIYNEKVLINLFDDSLNTSVLIESKAFSDTMRDIFKEEWKLGTKTKL